MQVMKSVGAVVVVGLAIGGVIFFQDSKKKADAAAEVAAGAYLMTLIKEEPNTITGTNGQQEHPWTLASNPTQLEVEEKMVIPRKLVDTTFYWDLRFDPKGGSDIQPHHVGLTFDQQGTLNSLSGIHGTISRDASQWTE